MSSEKTTKNLNSQQLFADPDDDLEEFEPSFGKDENETYVCDEEYESTEAYVWETTAWGDEDVDPEFTSKLKEQLENYVKRQ